jgi:hypothetical protein
MQSVIRCAPELKVIVWTGKKISIPMGMHKDHDAGVVGLVNYPTSGWML